MLFLYYYEMLCGHSSKQNAKKLLFSILPAIWQARQIDLSFLCSRMVHSHLADLQTDRPSSTNQEVHHFCKVPIALHFGSLLCHDIFLSLKACSQTSAGQHQFLRMRAAVESIWQNVDLLTRRTKPLIQCENESGSVHQPNISEVL